MDEYIKRSAAVQCARDVANDFKNEGFVEEAGAADTVGDWLQDFPAADVRPVILCKDCTALRDGISYCMYRGEYVNDSGYCSYGKKREES